MMTTISYAVPDHLFSTNKRGAGRVARRARLGLQFRPGRLGRPTDSSRPSTSKFRSRGAAGSWCTTAPAPPSSSLPTKAPTDQAHPRADRYPARASRSPPERQTIAGRRTREGTNATLSTSEGTRLRLARRLPGGGVGPEFGVGAGLGRPDSLRPSNPILTSERVEPPRPPDAADSEQESENHQKDHPLRYP